MCNLITINDKIILEKRGIIMNQEKIGKFISYKRKQKNLTQEKLAEQLGVSINAVSKWERGICLMDMSLLRPLSNILDVSINEILSGEDIKKEDFKKKADENIINITELYDLKSIKKGTVAFTFILLFFLLYFAKKNMDTLPIIIIWFVYNLSYTFNKYRYIKDKKYFIYALLFGIGLIVIVILFFMKSF